eukprot:8496806-Alexandrium_andersonii.AAC.1
MAEGTCKVRRALLSNTSFEKLSAGADKLGGEGREELAGGRAWGCHPRGHLERCVCGPQLGDRHGL